MGAQFVRLWDRPGYRHRIAHHAARRHAQRKRKLAHLDANWFKRWPLVQLDAWDREQWDRARGAVMESRKAVQSAPKATVMTHGPGPRRWWRARPLDASAARFGTEWWAVARMVAGLHRVRVVARHAR